MMIKDIDQLEATCDSELCKGHYQEDLIMESKLQSGLHVTPLLQYCYFAEYTLVFFRRMLWGGGRDQVKMYVGVFVLYLLFFQASNNFKIKC